MDNANHKLWFPKPAIILPGTSDLIPPALALTMFARASMGMSGRAKGTEGLLFAPGSFSDVVDRTTYTIPFAFDTETSTNNYAIVAICVRVASGTVPTITSATIDAVAAANKVNGTTASGEEYLAILIAPWTLNVGDGSSLVVNLTGTAAQLSFYAWSVKMPSATLFDSSFGEGSGAVTTSQNTISIPPRGFAVGMSAAFSSNSTDHTVDASFSEMDDDAITSPTTRIAAVQRESTAGVFDVLVTDSWPGAPPVASIYASFGG